MPKDLSVKNNDFFMNLFTLQVVLPQLASIRIAAYEESGRMIGHRVLPVIGLCPGYRHVALRTECGQSLPLANIFLHVIVKDYIPDGLSDFAEALANPIKYQSEIEKREKQLSALTDDLEAPGDGTETDQVCFILVFYFNKLTNLRAGSLFL